MKWVLLALAVLLFFWTIRESFEDSEFKSTTEGSTKFGVAGVGVAKGVTRPSIDSAEWKSKISAAAPIGSSESDYIDVLANFYDKVYNPATTKPTAAQVDGFLATPDGKRTGVDSATIRTLIMNAFHIDSGITAAQKEQKQSKFKPSDAIQPKEGVDQVRTRTESEYRPSDTRIGDLPEGQYAPVEQQEKPRHSAEFDDNSTSWRGGSFSAVGPSRSKNVL